MTNIRQQKEFETTNQRLHLAKSLLEKKSPSQEYSNSTGHPLDQKEAYQTLETLHTRQQEAITGILLDEQLLETPPAPRGFFSICYLPDNNFIEKKKLIHQKLVSLLQEKIDSYPLEFEWLHSFLAKRDVLLGQSNSTSSKGSNQIQSIVEKALEDTQNIGQSLLVHLPNVTDASADKTLDSLPDEELHYLNDIIDLVRKMQLFILGCHSSSYITMNKDQLTEVEESLKVKIKEFDQNDNIHQEIKEKHLAAQELLENHKTAFLLMETTSVGEAIDAAAKSAMTIHQAAKETEELKFLIESELAETRQENQESLKEEIEKIEKLHTHLLSAMLSYSAIHDEEWIEKQCGDLNALCDQITKAIDAVFAKAADLNTSNSEALSPQLKAILKQEEFKIDPPLLQPANPLEFLEELSTLSSTLHSERFIGIHGKIALGDSIDSSEQPWDEKTRREWTSGIDLMLLAICRTRSIQCMNKFAEKISVKRREKNSLKVEEVISFLFDDNQQPKYPTSFFVDPKMPHDDFLKMLSTHAAASASEGSAGTAASSNKMIKIDQATLAFNPFSKKPLNLPQEELSSAILRQREAGFQYVREALKKAFPEAFLNNEQMNEVLFKFDQAFKVTREGTLLTLGQAHAFIEREREILEARSCWQKHVVRYLGQ